MLFQQITKMSEAIRKIAISSSNHIGRDCIWHAIAAKELLKFEGYSSEVVIGVSAWRVGDADGAVIIHIPQKGKPINAGEFPYHCWVEMLFQDIPYILDTTAYQFKLKMSELDKQDGQTTKVVCNPSFLFMQKRHLSSLESVIQNDTGDTFYQEVPEFKSLLPTDLKEYQEDFNLLKLAYKHPTWKIIGPNDIKVI